MKEYKKGVILLPVIIVVTLLLVVGIFIYQNFQINKQQAKPNQKSGSKTNVTPSLSTETKDVINVSLEVQAPFSRVKLYVSSEKYIEYSSSDLRSNPPKETYEKNIISDEDFGNLEDMVINSNLYETASTEWTKNEPVDLSTYILTYSTLPSDPEEKVLADPAVIIVKCYESTCTEEFMNIKGEVIKIWGKDTLEVGI